MNIRIAIVDDQQSDREALKNDLPQHMPVGLSASISCFDSSETFLQGFTPGDDSLVFLDICMGGMNGICGAVTGAVTVLGYCNSKGPSDTTTKRESYRLASELEAAFQIKNGSLICKELKGVDTKVVLRSCQGCIEDACRFLEAKIRDKL